MNGKQKLLNKKTVQEVKEIVIVEEIKPIKKKRNVQAKN